AVTTLAGATTQGHADGTGTAAGFYYPFGVACDGSGNLYVADTYNNEIRKIVISSGSVTTFAGSTTSGSLDGSGTAASFTYPAGIVYDGSGNLYVSELYGNKIRKIVISSAAVTTLAGSGGSGSADGIGALATFSQPDGLTLDGKGNLFIADGGNYEVRMLNLTTHAVTTFAGSATYGSNDGTGSSAEFYTPGDIAYTGSGVFFVVDKYNGEIRKMTAAPKPVAAFTAATTTPCAGTAVQFTDNSTNAPLAWNWTFQDGTKTITSTLQNPSITFNTPGNDSVKLVVTNYTGKDSITKKLYINVNALPTLSISENVIGGSLVCGGHDTLKANATGVATLSYAWNTSGTFDTIMVGGPPAPYNGIVTTLAGSTNPGYADGTGTSAQFVGPSGVTYDGNGNLFIADQGSNRIRKVVIATGVVTAFAGTTASGSADGTGVAASFYQPSGIAYDGNGNLFVADQNNNEIRKVVIATGAVTTFAGSTTAGYADGTGTAASFSAPTGIAYDGSGNLFVVDQSNYEIRKIVISTGVVSTFAGSNSSPATLDGTGTAANFSYPYGIVSDGNGNLYVTEQYGNDIRKIVISTAAVTTLAGSVSSGSADGTGTAASFYYPEGIAYDGYGNLYVSDHQNNEIRRIVTSTGAVSTFAGTTTSGSADGTGTAASFSNPDGLVFDASGNLYLADQSNYEIRKIGVPNFYSVTVTDGNGCKNTTSASAVVYLPATISITGGAQCIGTADTLLAHATGIGSLTYSWNPGISVSDTNIITANNTYSATVVDANGCSATASKNIVLNTTPTLTVSENILGGSLVCGLYDTLTAKATGNGSFSYKWNTSGTHDTILVGGPPAPNLGKVSTFAGSTSNGSTDGTGTMASFYYPSGVAYDGNGNLYVADQYNQLIRKIVIATGAVTSFVGAANVSGNADGTGTAANFQYPTGIAYDGNGNLFVTDQYNNEIRKVVVATGAVSTFAGSATAGTADGIGTAAGFSSPIGITYDGSGNLYVTDQHNYEIRKIVISTGAVTTFAGSSASYATIDGTGTAASFSFPYGITSDGKGNLFVTEQYGNDIRKIVISTAAVTTIAGSSSSGSADGIGTAASFNQPQGITYDGFGNLYLCDGQNYEIRKIAVSTDAVSTIAGTTTFGSADGIGSAAGFNTPAGLAFDASGNLYVADQNNNKIRKIDIPNFYAVTITDKNGCKSTTSASALVYPAAKVTVSGGAQCMGTADTLIAHATATGPVTYNWSPLATGDTNIVLTNNTYSVTITDSVGCVAMTSKNIVMNTTPTVTVSENIIGGSIVCGLHDTLKANASGNGSFVYNWNTSGTHDTIIVGGPPAPSAGAVSTFAGTTTQGYADGIGGLAGFYSPAGMTYDGNGNMYVADAQAGEIRKIVLATRAVTTFAGSALIAAGSADGTGTSASFNWPNAITYDGNGNLYVADQNNNEIRKIVIATG
ncbi:MAG TPA: PKD domain-containing protein, partial [Bacteroidia bacterium]|nr:PKD domain-containing protein [Bacteroidia bacterium]